MKIEMGESLFYSWLRHVKECQLVQTNWKVSPQWNMENEQQIHAIYDRAKLHFTSKYGYEIFKQNTSFHQFLRQAECDVVGIAVRKGGMEYYAIDVAFHEGGLNYGSKEETTMKVVAKCIRNALGLYGYVNAQKAEIVFASPKIHQAVLELLKPCMNDINRLFAEAELQMQVRLICNEAFEKSVLEPILLVSKGVSDTSELFLRSYQLYTMFDSEENDRKRMKNSEEKTVRTEMVQIQETAYRELKIGQLANCVLREILQSDRVSVEELALMQETEYSKSAFGIQYPLLVKEGTKFDRIRYYSKPLLVRDEWYYLCSQWFETPANNDRSYLERWITEHS